MFEREKTQLMAMVTVNVNLGYQGYHLKNEYNYSGSLGLLGLLGLLQIFLSISNS